MILKYLITSKTDQNGNILALLFGSIALISLLSFSVFQLVSGPVSGAMQVNNATLTEAEMFLASQVAVTTSVTQPSGGDCDNDGFIEPFEFRNAASGFPAGGGFIPLEMGVPLTDVWGTEFGYCVWDVSITNDAACGGVSQNRLVGSITPTVGDYNSQTAIAIISAGPDRTFNTSCNAFTDINTDVITTSGDDIIQRFSYAEAESASGSLWQLNASDPSQAETNLDIAVGGNSTFSSINATGKIIATMGAQALDPGDNLTACSATSDRGTLRYDPVAESLEVCDGTAWIASSGVGSIPTTITIDSIDTVINDTVSTCAAEADLGKIRYNTSSNTLELCAVDFIAFDPFSSDPVPAAWHNFAVESEPLGLAVNRTSINLTVNGPGSPAFSANEIVSVTNLGSTTANLTTTLSDTTNFQLTTAATNPCGATLAGGASCNLQVRSSDSIGEVVNGTLTIDDGQTRQLTVDLTSTGINFCSIGTLGGGGVWAHCGESDFDYVITPPCQTTERSMVYNEPACTPATNLSFQRDPFNNPFFSGIVAGTTTTLGTGDANTELLTSQGFFQFWAAEYCSYLVYNGYDDWFMGSQGLMDVIDTNADTSTIDDLIMDGGDFLTSSLVAGQARFLVDDGTERDYITPTAPDAAELVRCVRKHPK